MRSTRSAVGAAGERLAAAYLSRQGLSVVERNLVIAGGELDLVALDGGRRVVVEVRTITGEGDPMQALGATKVDRVSRLGRAVGADRIDLVAIRLRPDAAELRWVRGAG